MNSRDSPPIFAFPALKLKNKKRRCHAYVFTWVLMASALLARAISLVQQIVVWLSLIPKRSLPGWSFWRLREIGRGSNVNTALVLGQGSGRDSVLEAPLQRYNWQWSLLVCRVSAPTLPCPLPLLPVELAPSSYFTLCYAMQECRPRSQH